MPLPSDGADADADACEEQPMTTLDLLRAKLDSDAYDLVRAQLDAMTVGAFADYQWHRPLSDAAIKALVRNGTTVEDLETNGYPSQIIHLFRTALHRALMQR